MNDNPPRDTAVESFSRWTAHESGETRITLDELHQLLENARRRSVLSYLASHPDEDVSFDEIVAAIAEGEYPDPGPMSHRERIEMDLHHVHLPKLANAGVVEYDPVVQTVHYESHEGIEFFLEKGTEIDGGDSS